MKNKSLFPLFILPIIWGIYYVAANKAVARLSVFSVGIVIRFVTFILLTIVMIVKKELPQLLKINHVWKKLIVIGSLGFLLDLTAFLGLVLVPAGIGTVLLKIDIIFVNLISAVFYKQKFRWRDWIYTLAMLGGIVLVMDINFSSVELGGVGNIFFILSALFVSINAFVIQSAQNDEINPVSDNVVAYYNNLITLALFTIAGIITGDIAQISGIKDSSSLMVFLGIASVGQTLIYVFYYFNLRHFPVWIVKVFLLNVPIVSALVSLIFFGEKLVISQYAGMAIVLLCAGGMLAGQRKESTKTETFKTGEIENEQ